MKTILVSMLLVVVGCSASDPTPAPETKLSWAHEGNDAAVVGKDESGNVRARFDQVITVDADGAKHGVLSAEVDGRKATMEYVVTADHRGQVLQNDIPQFPEATRMARLAHQELASSGNLGPRDLLNPPTGLLSCVPSIIAAVCIVAASCGIGGNAGGELTGAVIEAGTEQCSRE